MMATKILQASHRHCKMSAQDWRQICTTSSAHLNPAMPAI
jgi:hypothetical protein